MWLVVTVLNSAVIQYIILNKMIQNIVFVKGEECTGKDIMRNCKTKGTSGFNIPKFQNMEWGALLL